MAGKRPPGEGQPPVRRERVSVLRDVWVCGCVGVWVMWVGRRERPPRASTPRYPHTPIHPGIHTSTLLLSVLCLAAAVLSGCARDAGAAGGPVPIRLSFFGSFEEWQLFRTMKREFEA